MPSYLGYTKWYVDENNTTYCSVDGLLYSKDLTTLIDGSGKSSYGEIELPESVNIIGDYAFYDNDYLGQINDMLKNITSIGKYAFYGSGSFTAIVIPDGVTRIGEGAFSRSYYRNISISNSIQSIENLTFYNCSSLEEVVIGQSVTNVGNSAFENCTRLSTATLGESVTIIGESAFQNCSKLENITSLNPTPPTCEAYAYGGVSKSSCTIYVPKGAKDAYASADTWQDFSNIVEME